MEQSRETSLVLRTCRADLTSRNGFQWAGVGGITVAPDWNTNEECGNGLHGWLYGAGNHSCSDYLSADAAWMVLEVVTADIIMLDGKCKFPRAKTVFVGGRKEAAESLLANEPRSSNVKIIGRIAEVGDSQSLIGGALSVLTGGDGSTLTGGYRSTLNGGDRSTLTGGDGSTLTGGYRSTLTGGDGSTLTGGNCSTLTGGDQSTLTGGNYSTLTGGDQSTLTGGDGSELRIRYWDTKAERYRTAIAYVGENGIEAGAAYRLDESHQFVKAIIGN